MTKNALATEQGSLQAVQQMYAAWGRGDMGAVLDSVSDDVEWVVAGPSSIPFCGSRHGREAVAGFFKALGESLETQLFVPEKFIAQGEDVVVLGHERHRVPSTGRLFEDDWVQVFTVRAGKIVRYREYLDTAALVNAFASG